MNIRKRRCKTMKKMKVLLTVVFSLLASLALTLGMASAGAFCAMIFHQPQIPQGISEYKKNKKLICD